MSSSTERGLSPSNDSTRNTRLWKFQDTLVQSSYYELYFYIGVFMDLRAPKQDGLNVTDVSNERLVLIEH